jgi:hypothetical protein
LFGHPGGDAGVVGGRAAEGLGGEAFAKRERRGAALRPELRQQPVVLLRRGHHSHEGVVLGRRAQQGRAADVDLLQGLGGGDVGAADRLLERIQVDAHHVDGRDAVVGQGAAVGLRVAAGQYGPVNCGVQRLDPAAHHLGAAGHLLDLDDGDSGVGQGDRRAPGGDDLDLKLGQSLSQGY